MIDRQKQTDSRKWFESFVNEYYAQVFYHCIKLMGNDAEAADVTQNTFVKAYMNMGRIRDINSAAPWLFTICNNEIRSYYRSSRKPEIPDSEPDTRKSYASLYSAIDFLDERYRKLIILKYFAGFSMQEISILTNLSVNLVKSRLYEARTKLKTMLSDEETAIAVPKNKQRRMKLMSTVKLIELGAKTVPFMSVWGQNQLMKCARANTKFTPEVLTELSRIPEGEFFVLECKGSISYDEFIKILSICDEAMIYRLSGNDFRTWRNGRESQLICDLAAYLNTGAYVDSVEMMLYVPSIIETVTWYSKYLGWDGSKSQEDEDYGYGQLYAYDTATGEYMYNNFKGFHLRKAEGKISNASCFVFVTGIDKLRDKIIAGGWDKVTEINDNGWGTKGFSLTDLNGFVLEFCEWICE